MNKKHYQLLQFVDGRALVVGRETCLARAQCWRNKRRNRFFMAYQVGVK